MLTTLATNVYCILLLHMLNEHFLFTFIYSKHFNAALVKIYLGRYLLLIFAFYFAVILFFATLIESEPTQM